MTRQENGGSGNLESLERSEQEQSVSLYREYEKKELEVPVNTELGGEGEQPPGSVTGPPPDDDE